MKRGRTDAPPPGHTAAVSRPFGDRSNMPTAAKAGPASSSTSGSGRGGPRALALEKQRKAEAKQQREVLREHFRSVVEDQKIEILRLQKMIEAETAAESALEAAIEAQLDVHDAKIAQLVCQGEEELAVLDDEAAVIAHQRHALRDEAEAQLAQEAHTEEANCLAMVSAEELEKEIIEADENILAAKANLKQHQTLLTSAQNQFTEEKAELELKHSSTYGVSSEVGRIVSRSDQIDSEMVDLDMKGREVEIDRRVNFNKFEELKGTIRVYCRVKGGEVTAKFAFPDGEAALAAAAAAECDVSPGDDDSSEEQPPLVPCTSQAIEIVHSRANATSTGVKETSLPFSFDRVYPPESEQKIIFDDVGSLVDCAVDGYKVCIMAYGQTGSGKTYTMEGPDISGSGAGIIPRSIDKVFDRAQHLKPEGWKYTMSCYFIEIYNDTIRDLLETSEEYHRAFTTTGGGAKGPEQRHDIQHKGKVDTIITNISERVVKCPADVHKLLATAVKNRSTAKTALNERSSRSHCIFTMKIEGVNDSIKQRSTGTLCLVDLAGSERVNESGVQGQQFKEAVAINRSLSSLGDCIAALGSNATHVSWRSNKLTHLLQNYLGGEGAKMLMFVMVSNSEEHVNESVNSLRFASKVNSTRIGTAKKRVMNM